MSMVDLEPIKARYERYLDIGRQAVVIKDAGATIALFTSPESATEALALSRKFPADVASLLSDIEQLRAAKSNRR